MHLIIGLGNPGNEYRDTRHNVGRETATAFGTVEKFPKFIFHKKWNALVSERRTSEERVVLLLPETMMNRSGTAVAPAARMFKVKPKDVYVIHDDADIVLGSTKLSFNKHSAGHKGVESVIRALKTRKFWRFRIGIAGKRDIPAEKLVLKNFTPEETRTMRRVTKKTTDALARAIAEGPERATNEYNR